MRDVGTGYWLIGVLQEFYQVFLYLIQVVSVFVNSVLCAGLLVGWYRRLI